MHFLYVASDTTYFVNNSIRFANSIIAQIILASDALLGNSIA